jgi:hypothetical protein
MPDEPYEPFKDADMNVVFSLITTLSTVPESEWDRLIESAKIFCKGRTPAGKQRAPRSDKGKPRGDKSMGVPE